MTKILKYLISNIKTKPTGICIAVILAVQSFPAQAQSDSWQQKQSLGLAAPPRTKAIGFSIAAKGYIGLGSSVGVGMSGPDNKDFWEFDQATNVWTQRANYPGSGSSGAVGFSIGNKGYLGTGSHSLSIGKDFWEYDPSTNLWTQKADFGGGIRVDGIGFSIGSKGYIGTGNTGIALPIFFGTHQNDFWEYDPAIDTWTQKSAFPGAARSQATGISIGNKGYIGLGYTSSTPYSGMQADFWQYDPVTDSWIQKADFSVGARFGACGFSIGGMGYIGTGSSPQNQNDFYRYDTSTNTWSGNISFVGSVRESAVGFSIAGKGYIGTGDISEPNLTMGALQDFYEFDPSSNIWTQKANLGGGVRSNAVSFSIAGKGYVGTGSDGSPKKDFWAFDPATNVWTQVADFPGIGRAGAVGLAIGNKGYVGTGIRNGGRDNWSDFYEYDPSNNTWAGIPLFPAFGREGAASFSIGNKGYFGLGYYRATFLTDFWEYDPATKTWTQKAMLPYIFPGPSGPAVGFNVGDTGYISLGNPGNNFWAYDPNSDSWTRKADFGGITNAFSIRDKGYAYTEGSDFWEYDPPMDHWTKKASFTGPGRGDGIGFSTGSNGFIGFGSGLNDLWEYFPVPPDSIMTQAIAGPYCSSKTFPVIYTAQGTFNTDNSFTAQLSDSSGSFASPQSIGVIAGTSSDTIACTIPKGNTPGTRYRIRVVSSSPLVIGSDNGNNLIINPPPTAKTQARTIYLDGNGQAILSPSDVDSGSTGACGPLTLSLDKTEFTCDDLGSNTVLLTGSDGNGRIASANALVIVKDSLPPSVTGIFAKRSPASRNVNNKMMLYTVNYETSDNCRVSGSTLSASSNQMQTRTFISLGNKTEQIVVDDHHVILDMSPTNPWPGLTGIADRNRVYDISITAKDSSGNATTRTLRLVVSNFNGDIESQTVLNDSLVNTISSGVVMNEINNELHVQVTPNPSGNAFTLITQSGSGGPLLLIVQDMLGQIMERRTNLQANGEILIGSSYKPGMYFAQIIQGTERVFLKLIKR